MKRASEEFESSTLLAALIPVLLALGCLAGCRSALDSDAESRAARSSDLEVQFVDRPPSAFVALVRMLEVVDAMRAPDTDIRVRAIEGDALPGRQQDGEHVRILLDMTLFARDFTAAQCALDELVSALETEGRATARVDEIAPLRLRRVFEDMRWSGASLREESAYDGLVSVSNTLRIEVYAGSGREPWPAGQVAGPAESGGAASRATEPADEYVRQAATAEGFRIGPLAAQAKTTRDGRSDLRYQIRPADRRASLTRLQIGSFLQRIEARSPGVRITHVEITPADTGEDVRADLWTFQAVMNIRVRGEE